MKKHHYITNIEIPIYRGELIIILSNDKENINKELENEIVEYSDSIYGRCICDSYKGKQGFFIVLNLWEENSKMTHGAITHESIHVCAFLFDGRGIKADFKNDEPVTYLAEWITNQVYQFIEKNKLMNHIFTNIT